MQGWSKKMRPFCEGLIWTRQSVLHELSYCFLSVTCSEFQSIISYDYLIDGLVAPYSRNDVMIFCRRAKIPSPLPD